jgi:hypothetical protein
MITDPVYEGKSMQGIIELVQKGFSPTDRKCFMRILAALRGGPGCLNRFSASISGASAGVRLPSGVAAAGAPLVE